MFASVRAAAVYVLRHTTMYLFHSWTNACASHHVCETRPRWWTVWEALFCVQSSLRCSYFPPGFLKLLHGEYHEMTGVECRTIPIPSNPSPTALSPHIFYGGNIWSLSTVLLVLTAFLLQ